MQFCFIILFVTIWYKNNKKAILLHLVHKPKSQNIHVTQIIKESMNKVMKISR